MSNPIHGFMTTHQTREGKTLVRIVPLERSETPPDETQMMQLVLPLVAQLSQELHALQAACQQLALELQQLREEGGV